MANAGFSFKAKKLTEAEFRQLVFSGPKGEAIMTFVANRERTDASEYALDQMQEELRLHLGYKIPDFKKRCKEAGAEHDRIVAEAKAAAFVRQNPNLAFGGTLPTNYVLSAEGLYFVHMTGPLKLLGPCSIVGKTTHGDGKDDWSILLKWSGENGVEYSWPVSYRLMGSAFTETVNELSSRGLFVTPNAAAQEKLKLFFLHVEVDTWLTTIGRPGWTETESGITYVLPSGEAIGPGADLVYPTVKLTKHAAAFQAAGTLEDWQDKIAQPARGNARLVVAIAQAFVGPVLKRLRRDSFIIHFYFDSRTGKTTAARMAVSVYGCAKEGEAYKTWDMTTNAVEGNAERANDGLFVLDELSKAKRGVPSQVAYNFAGGTGKSRLRADISMRELTNWTAAGLSTGEKSLEMKLLEDGYPLNAGQEVRFISLSADAGKGLGILEELHSYPTSAAFVNAMIGLTQEYYGTAIRAFITRLIEDIERDEAAITAWITAHANTFAVEAAKGASSQAADVAGSFGLNAAMGELATRYGVVPWAPGEATRAARVCFEAWRETRKAGLGQAEAAKIVELVREDIRTYQYSRFMRLSDFEDSKAGSVEMLLPDTTQRTDKFWGYRDPGRGGERLFWVEPGALAEMSKVPVSHVRTAARALRDAGWLITEGERNTRRLRLPEGQQRLYCIRGAILDSGGERETYGPTYEAS